MINDRYKIIKKLGEGRSKVFLCEDILRNETELAIKILPSTVDNEEQKSFRDEYFLLKKLDHPNIISVFEYGSVILLSDEDKVHNISEGSHFFTLEYFEGNELFDFPGIQAESDLIQIICQLSVVLFYLHQSAYIYYDIKSENILVKEKNGKPVLKFIDFGLAVRIQETREISARGTAEYIAPEILRKEKIDHRADLYSLGILLYRIIYGKFPFPNKDQLSIYKAHLDEEFIFPDSPYGDKIVNLVKKLLSKEVSDRFFTSIGILAEFNPLTINEYKNDWVRIPVFAGRNDSISIISAYIEKGNGGEILAIKGSEGSGKSTLLSELNYKYNSSLLISTDRDNDAYMWQSLLRVVLYQQNIYSGLSPYTFNKAKSILNGNSKNLIEDLKALFIKISSINRFVLLIDGFNSLSGYDLEIFFQLIPVLQVSKIKIVIAEDSGKEYKSTRINNLQVINLNPFTETQVTEFIKKSFASFYPISEIKKIIISYSDLLPGSIEIFLKDLIVLNLLGFVEDGPVISKDTDFDNLLKSSQEEIYQIRLKNLDPKSRDIAILLSMFNVNLDIPTIVSLTGEQKQIINRTLEKLSESNIIHPSNVLGNPQFTNQGIKEYIYSTIENKSEAHLKIAELISDKIPFFNRNEFARHFELAGKYDKSYEVLQEELEKAERTSAFSYKKNLLKHLVELPLTEKNLRTIQIDLSYCYYQLGELNAAIDLINELLQTKPNREEIFSLNVLKGKALIAIQSLEEGKKLLEEFLIEVEEGARKNEILAEIVEAEYEMAKYDEAEKIANQLIADSSTSTETLGKVYRIKGLIELFKNNKPLLTIEYLEEALKKFGEKHQLAKVATMENNLGNIYNIVHESDKAEMHWKKSIELNSSIGNLLQNGINFLSSGIYKFENCNYEEAINYYLNAQSIFTALGETNNLGITFINLGEVYLITCEYEQAVNLLKAAIKIYDELENRLEKGEAIFLLGKTFFEIGDSEDLNEIVLAYSDFTNMNIDKLDFNYKYLNVLYDISVEKFSGTLEKLFLLRERSKNLTDNFIYCEIQLRIIDILINNARYMDASNELMVDDFVNICENHIYFGAYRDLLMGRVSEVQKIQETKPVLYYYEEAYKKISSTSITELTWKILYELYRMYKKRGNTSRISDFKRYTQQIILHIANEIKSEHLKLLYLENPERNKVLKELRQELK